MGVQSVFCKKNVIEIFCGKEETTRNRNKNK